MSAAACRVARACLCEWHGGCAHRCRSLRERTISAQPRVRVGRVPIRIHREGTRLLCDAARAAAAAASLRPLALPALGAAMHARQQCRTAVGALRRCVAPTVVAVVCLLVCLFVCLFVCLLCAARGIPPCGSPHGGGRKARTCRALHVACRALHVARCMPCVACCMLCVARCMLHAVRCTVRRRAAGWSSRSRSAACRSTARRSTRG
jgi:hypothetical protein